MDPPQQSSKRGVARLVVVVVDGLAKQRDFHSTGAHKPAYLLDDGLRRAVYLGAAGHRHDAKRAEFVAAPRDAYVRLP